MTQQRIEEIKKYTVGRALKQLENVDYSNPNAAFHVGKIFGELDNNLSKELSREKTKSFIMEKKRNENFQQADFVRAEIMEK